MADLYLIGMTGNIACGKSTVLAMLREQGAAVIDADQVTHRLQQPGTPVYDAIVRAFGKDIVLEPGGPIDRKKLGGIVFTDRARLRELEQIVHPAVRAEIQQWLAARHEHAASAPSRQIAVIDAIKLLESGWQALCQAVWVVTCPPEQQARRLMETRGMSAEEAQVRIAAQPPQSEKVAQATVVIDNGGTLEATRAQVMRSLAAMRDHP